MDPDNSVATARRKRGEVEVEVVVEVGIGGAERNFAWANERMMQCANDLLLSRTLETSMVLQTKVTLINSGWFCFVLFFKGQNLFPEEYIRLQGWEEVPEQIPRLSMH